MSGLHSASVPDQPPMPSLSLRLKLTLGAISISALLLLIQSSAQFFALRGDLAKRIEQEQFILLSTLAKQLDDKLVERQLILSQSAKAIPLDKLGDPAELEKYLQSKSALLVLFDDLYIYNAQGVLLVDWPLKPTRHDLDMADRDYIQCVRQTLKPCISRPILSRATGQPIIVLVAPVLDASGELRAIAGGVLNLYQAKLIGELGKQKMTDDGYIYLVSKEGLFIAHPDRSRIMQPIPPAEENPSLAAAMQGFEGTREGINSRQLRGLFTFKRLPSTGWTLASVIPSEAAFAPILTIGRTMASITLFLMLLMVPLLWGFSRRLVLPLEQLAAAMRQRATAMRPQQPAEPIAESGSSEIRTVAAAFNEFLGARNGAEQALADSEAKRTHIVENLARARDAAEAASLAKSQFLANMSHEIRTPMNGIIGTIDLALMNALDEDSRTLASIARDSAESLLGILNDILDVSKIEAGKLQIVPGPFDLAELIHDILSLMDASIREKGLSSHLDLPAELPEMLIGDALRIRQVLLNLIGNAIKFTPEGSITTRLEIEHQDTREIVIACTVADTGIGIPAERQEAIFNAFAQADSSTTRHFGGTGLGLTISRQLIELMGGTLTVVSHPGQGSAFRFTLALALPG